MAAKVAVVGAGGWGTALSLLLYSNGAGVVLWARREEKAKMLREERVNRDNLPGVTIPPGVGVTSDLAEALEGAALVILTVPTHGLRQTLRRAAPLLKEPVPLVCAAKGLEEESLKRPSEVIKEELGPGCEPRLLNLSGPNFAAEVARGLPTTTVLAFNDESMATFARDFLMNERFRVYLNPDVVGVEIGGALKNVIALAAGMADGLSLGYNARASLITRGLSEMIRLGTAMGANPLTFSGLSGLGDLVLTCTGELSRNRRAGYLVGQGRKIQEVLAGTKMVVEGVRTTRAAYRLSLEYSVSMPITEELYRILYEGEDPREGVRNLMGRQASAEIR